MTADPTADPAREAAAAVNTGVAETLIADALLHHSWCTVDRGHCTCRPNRLTDARAVLATPLLRDALTLRARVTALPNEWDEQARTWYYDNRFGHEHGIGYVSGYEDGWSHAAELLRAALNPQAGA